VETVIRFDMRGPKFGAPKPGRYSTALDMAQHADGQGVDVIMLCEHHGVEDGCLRRIFSSTGHCRVVGSDSA
jgi:hypothetical protein